MSRPTGKDSKARRSNYSSEVKNEILEPIFKWALIGLEK